MDRHDVDLKKCSRFLALGFLACLIFRFSLWNLELRHLPRVGLEFPVELDMALSCIMFGSLVIIVLRGLEKATALSFCLSMILLLISDNMRIRSWVYTYLSFFSIYGIGLWFAKENRDQLVTTYWQWLTVAVYFWSGALKFNVGFMVTVIPYLFDDFVTVPAEIFAILGLLIPFTEALFPVLLIFPLTRRLGVLGLLGMHFFILLVLGPFGKNLSQNVWAWNVTMSFLVFNLFWLNSNKNRLRFPKTAISAVFIFVYFLLPPLHLVNLWNGNLSFNMFSGRLPDAFVFLTEETEKALPYRLKRIVQEEDGRRFITINKYAVDETGVYVYPSTKVVDAMVYDLCNTVKEGDVLIRGIPPLLKSTGKTEETNCQAILSKGGE